MELIILFENLNPSTDFKLLDILKADGFKSSNPCASNV